MRNTVSASIPTSQFEMPDLTGMRPDVGLQTTLEACEKFLLGDEKVREWVEAHGLPLVQGTQLDQAVRYMAVRNGTIIQGGGWEDYHLFLSRIVQQALDFTNEQVVNAARQFELNPGYILLMEHAMELAELHNQLFLEWRIACTWPMEETERETGFSQKQIAEIMAMARLENRYSAVANRFGELVVEDYDLNILRSYREIPLIKAFPVVHGICRILHKLYTSKKMKSLPWMKNYLKALHDAYAETSLDSLEEKWFAVDEAWIKIPKNALLIPVHAMEYGYGHPYMIMPEFRIVLRLRKGADVLRHLKNRMHEIAVDYGDDIKYPRKQGRVDVVNSCCIIASGVTMDFRYAGQSVPNRPEVQDKGMKLFMDYPGIWNRLTYMSECAKRCLTPTSFMMLQELLTFDGMHQFVTGHECGHAVCITDKLETKFGVRKRFIEETKATLLSIKANVMDEAGSDVHYKVACELLAEMTANICRHFQNSMFTKETIQPYIFESMVFCNILMETGFLVVVDGKLHANFGDADVVEATIKNLLATLDTIMSAYGECDFSPIQEILDTMADSNSDVIVNARKLVDDNLDSSAT